MANRSWYNDWEEENEERLEEQGKFYQQSRINNQEQITNNSKVNEQLTIFAEIDNKNKNVEEEAQ